MKHALRILIFVLFTYSLSLISAPVFAQTATQSSTALTAPSVYSTSSTFGLPSTVNPTSPLYTDLIVSNMFHTFSCLAIGQSMIGQPCLTYKITQNAQGLIQGVPVLSQVNLNGGALGTVSSLITALYLNPPVRTGDYLASVGHGLGIAKEARAQGVAGSGATVLSPILSLWQVSRNISYVVMIIIFVIIGMMVMFRNKINPQTVITAQTALPGLIIGLILITFSYFLAGLITDMAFVGVNVVGYYFSAASQPSTTPKLVQDIATENVGSIFSKFVGMVGSGDISGLINSILSSIDGGVQFWLRLLAGIIGFQAGSSFGGPILSMAGPLLCTATGVGVVIAPLCGIIGQVGGAAIAGTILGAITFAQPAETFGLVLSFVALAILIYTMFKLLLKLITVYLNIIFLTITAPFQLLFASLPGRQGIATGWMLSILSNILAFPAVFAVFYFAAYLLGPTFNSGQFFGTSSPQSLASTATLPLFGGLDLKFLNVLVAFVALMATPTIPEIISRALGKFSQAGQIIGQELGSGARSGQNYAGRLGAAPGQAMKGLEPLRQLGTQYEDVITSQGPQVLVKPNVIKRFKGGPGSTPHYQ